MMCKMCHVLYNAIGKYWLIPIFQKRRKGFGKVKALRLTNEWQNSKLTAALPSLWCLLVVHVGELLNFLNFRI
jgi:hypothetical protein